jgi:hypothetical protein
MTARPRRDRQAAAREADRFTLGFEAERMGGAMRGR